MATKTNVMFSSFQGKSHRWAFFIPLVFISYSIILYFGIFDNEFHFDDYAYIVDSDNAATIEMLLKELRYHLLRPDRTLVSLSFAMNYWIHGDDVFGYHLVNVVIHGLNGSLLFLFLLQLQNLSKRIWCQTGNPFRLLSLFSTLVFLSHPAAVHSVAYITQRHGLLATFFFLSSCVLYMTARSTPPLSFLLKRGLYFAAAAAFWASIHCKPMAITLPLVVVGIEIVFFSGNSRKAVFRSMRWVVPVLFIFVVLLVLYAVKSGLFSSNALLAGFQSDFLWSPWQHAMTESLVFLHYWRILLVPLPIWLCVDHYFPVIQELDWRVICSWFVHGTIIGGCVWLFVRGKLLPSFGIAWFYLTLTPPYFVLPIQDVMVDYKTYLPSIGFAMVLCSFFSLLHQKIGRRGLQAFVIVLLMISCFSALERMKKFKTEELLWTDAINKYPDNPRPYNNRGLAFSRHGQHYEAIQDYKKALALLPDYSLVYANIGDSYKAVGNLTEAAYAYEQYLKYQPDDGDGYVRLANVFALKNNWAKALIIYKEAIKVDPDNVGALYNSGLAYGQLGKTDQALETFNKVVSIAPEHTGALNSIGAMHYFEGNRVSAMQYFTDALQSDPDNKDALYNLTVCYIHGKEFVKALKTAQRLKLLDQDRGERLLSAIETLKK